MSSQPAPPPGSRGGRAPAARAGVVLVAVVMAACTSGGAPTREAPTATPASTLQVSAAPAEATTAPGRPTKSPDDAVPAEPPAATLAGADGSRVEGTLGSYTWANGGSDTPWIVPGPDRAASLAGPHAVTFAPPVPIASWTAAWAPVDGGAPGDVAGSEAGTTGKLVFAGPGRDDAWSLKLDVRFASGDQATWYWRLEAAP